MSGIMPGRPRPAVLIGGGALLLAVGVSLFLLLHPSGSSKTPARQTAVIEQRPFTTTLALSGVIALGDPASVTAPFDGRVVAVSFDYGAPVKQGQPLLSLDLLDLRQRRQEAQGQYLKAMQAAAEMAAWGSGPEVSQARRAEASAEAELDDTRRKLVQTKVLLDRGLVARDEYDGLMQQQRSQDMALAAARQELEEALKHGTGANREVVELELQTARARFEDIAAQDAGGVVRAPVSGVIIHPPGEKADASSLTIHPGSTLTRGQLIGAIARPGGLAVSFQLSESDADKVHPGQPVEVTGPGFDGVVLNGAIRSVSREASPASTSSAAVTYAGIARLAELTPAQAAIVRIGMTANVSVDVYRNPAALTAPPGAIQGAAPDAFVMVRNPASGAVRRVRVRVGQVAPDGVEVLSGLKAGDVVVWTPVAGSGDTSP